MINKLNFEIDGLSTSGPSPDGWKWIGFKSGTFSELSESINSIGSSTSDYIRSCGDIIDNAGVTGTQSETILWSMKIPRGFYNVGDVFTIGPSVMVWGGYDAESEHLAPGPIESFEYVNGVRLFVSDHGGIVSYDGTFTFSQISTNGSGSGLVVELTFNSGSVISGSIVDGGSGYVPYIGEPVNNYEIITLEDKGFGSRQLRVNSYSEPTALLRSYWSYSESSLDNLCEQVTIDHYNYSWKHIFNAATPSNSQSGFLPAYSEIIDNTTIKFISGVNSGEFLIGTCSIPDISQDIWFTITGELDDPNTNLFLGLMMGLKDVTGSNLILGDGSTYIDPFSPYTQY